MENNIFTQFPILTTNRLTLRQIQLNDDKGIFLLRSNEKVNKLLDRENAISIEDALVFIHKISDRIIKNELFYWAITLKNNNTLIGTICLFNFSKEKNEAEIGYELIHGYQGKGIMQEAVLKVIEFGFLNMDLKIISAYSHIENKRSSKLLEKLNFKKQENPEMNNEKNFIVYNLINM